MNYEWVFSKGRHEFNINLNTSYIALGISFICGDFIKSFTLNLIILHIVYFKTKEYINRTMVEEFFDDED